MPKYKALKKVWLSNECRTVEEGDIFETEFPLAPMENQCGWVTHSLSLTRIITP